MTPTMPYGLPPLPKHRAQELGLTTTGKATRAGNRSEESRIQSEVMKWRDLGAAHSFPVLSDLYAIPNGTFTGWQTAKRMKREGVKSGVSDLHLPVPIGGFAGLWIEVKTPDGQLSTEQREWLTRMHGYGHCTALARSTQECVDVLLWYVQPEARSQTQSPVALWTPGLRQARKPTTLRRHAT